MLEDRIVVGKVNSLQSLSRSTVKGADGDVSKELLPVSVATSSGSWPFMSTEFCGHVIKCQILLCGSKKKNITSLCTTIDVIEFQ